MLSDANINYTQANIIARHLRVWFGKPIISSTSKLKKRLINNNPRPFVQPECGTQKFDSTNEVVDWSVRDPVKLLLFFLDGVFNRKKTKLRWNSVDVVVSCDHGKGFSHAHVVFICRRRDEETGEWSEFSDSYSIAQAKCNKVTYEILQKSFMPKLNAGLESIQHKGGFNVWKRKPPNNDMTGGEQDSCDANPEENDCNEDDNDDCDDAFKSQFYTSLLGFPPKHDTDELLYGNIPVQLFSAGNLAQLMTNHGREGMGTYWCCYCNLPRYMWQQPGHCKGTPWTLPQLALQVELNNTIKDKKNQKQQKGVKTEALLSAIEALCTSIPLIHLMLGVINKAKKSLLASLQAACEKYTELYVQLEKKLQLVLNKEARLVSQKKTAEARVAVLKREMSQNRTIELKAEWEQVQSEINECNNKQKQIATENKVAKNVFLAEADADENTKNSGQKFCADIEGMYRKFGINKAAFHGGDLQGSACRTLVSRRVEIFSKIWNLILELPEEQKVVSEQTIKDVMEGYERLLGHFNAMFAISRMNRHHVSDDNFINLEAHIECACAQCGGGLRYRLPQKCI